MTFATERLEEVKSWCHDDGRKENVFGRLVPASRAAELQLEALCRRDTRRPSPPRGEPSGWDASSTLPKTAQSGAEQRRRRWRNVLHFTLSPSSFLMRNSPTCTVSESLSAAAGLVAAPSATSSSVVFRRAGCDSRVVLWLGTPVEWCVEAPSEKVGKTREEE